MCVRRWRPDVHTKGLVQRSPPYVLRQELSLRLGSTISVGSFDLWSPLCLPLLCWDYRSVLPHPMFAWVLGISLPNCEALFPLSFLSNSLFLDFAWGRLPLHKSSGQYSLSYNQQETQLVFQTVPHPHPGAPTGKAPGAEGASSAPPSLASADSTRVCVSLPQSAEQVSSRVLLDSFTGSASFKTHKEMFCQ